MIIKCANCGKEIEVKGHSRRKYCTPLCGRQMNAGINGMMHEKTKTNQQVTDVAKLAQEAGMSYGQYVGKMYSAGRRKKK